MVVPAPGSRRIVAPTEYLPITQKLLQAGFCWTRLLSGDLAIVALA